MSVEKEGHFFSIIVPAYNDEHKIKDTLSSVFDSRVRNFEVIVVNDGSSDATAIVAAKFPCKVLTFSENKGAAAARNAGARIADGDILVFIDSDVIVEKDFLERFTEAFAQADSPDAVIGVYGKKRVLSNMFSVYKNLFLHLNQDNDSPRFWSGCAAIKKEVFLGAGGFDETKKGALAEDTAFGYILHKNGRRICIRRDIQVRHGHRYTLAGIFKNDFLKTAEWVRVLASGLSIPKANGYYLNVKNFLSLFCAFAMLTVLPLAVIKGSTFINWMFLFLFVFVALNFTFYAMLVKEAGIKYVFLGPLLHVFSHIAAILGIFYGFFNLFKTRT